MRDLKRANAKRPAYKELMEMAVEVFTPMAWRLAERRGRRMREEAPFIHGLLFVHEARERLDPIVEGMQTLQYRWMRHTYRKPMTVKEEDMERFIHAVNTSETTRYYLPEEITPEMRGRKVRIIGGAMDGYEGRLLKARGSKFRELLVEIPNCLTAAVRVCPEFIQYVKD